MPFTDGLSNVSGRNSRASNVSASTGAPRSLRSPPAGMPPNDTLANAGVLSMLKTSTDTGDIGALSFNTSRLPSVPRATHQRRGHASRPSVSAQMSGATSNHSYAPSQTSRVSSQWDGASTQRRGSLTSMQSMPPSIPPAHLGKPSLGPMPPTPADPRDSRSYSMTSAPPAQGLPRHRSAASLKSQGHEPHRMPPGPVPPMPEHRPPFVYPTRLKRPGYRSPSPALSDTYAHGALPGPPPMSARPPAAGVPQLPVGAQYYGCNAGYSGAYHHDPRHLNVRQPPRGASSSSGVPGVAYDPTQYGYRPKHVRQMPMVHPLGAPMMPPAQQPIPPPRGPYPGPQYGPPRPGYTPYGPIPHPGHRGHPPPSVGPTAHHMFHNAARMARQLPQRTDTPMTDIPSSDPPSSGSAPDSSNPPTPKDHTTIQVVVDPAFINADLADLPDSSSDPVLPAKYFDYADGLEKPIHDPDMEVPHPSVPPSGFVQRVKAMLESKAAADAAAKNEREGRGRIEQGQGLDVEHEQGEISDFVEVHELAANETPRFTVIEEFEAPVELPASPVRVAELEAAEPTQKQSTQRITRELIRAELGPSSADNTQVHPDDTTTNLILGMQQKYEAEEPSLSVSVRPLPAAHNEADQLSGASADEKNQHDRVGETVVSDTVDATLPTGLDYAMRFSGVINTTVASDETQSKDPFALDADTITMSQQHSKDQPKEPLQGIKDTATSEQIQGWKAETAPARTPVSPLRADEEVKRSSAVSPVHTEITLGIDETIRLANEDRTMTSSSADEQPTTTQSSHAEESLPPPTPRTPKIYSKSVQLRPSVTVTDTNSTSTNRFSLPGDLSTIADTTMNSASEMVTDVAVRFSLPGTSITIGKPQIVDVSTNSTPDKGKEELALPHFATQNAELKSTRRSSVAFADEVAPLKINKKAEPHRPLQGAEATASRRKSIIRKPSSRDDTIDSNRSRESNPDTRFSNTNNLNGLGTRFRSTHLPGLKEESIEDVSISDHKRWSDKAEFPLPARIAAVKAMQERRLQESAEKAKARRQARQYNRPLADARDLPSLNFSRIDLIDRLNEALEIRPAKSMEVVRRRDFTGIHCPSPQRPQSTEPLRERYTSFFSKPEDFSFMDEPVDSDDDEPDEAEHCDHSEALVPTVPTLQVQEQTEIEGVEPAKRPLSPEDFLNVASQVSRLSIPNVGGLSDRLSELIPGLRNLSDLQLDGLFAAERRSMQLGQSGDLTRPDTVTTVRTSAGFRTLAERAEEIVRHGTHDSMVPSKLSLNKDLPPLPESASVDKLSGTTPLACIQPYLSGSVSVPVDLGKDPARPASALLRSKAPTTEEEVQEMLPKEMNPITRGNRRSMITSQTSRPWNLDKNYPWAGNKVEIDLLVPSQAHTRNSFASEVLRERRTRSLDLSQPLNNTDTTKGIDIGSIFEHNISSSTSVTNEQLTGINPQHTRTRSKRSIIGSISRKFGLGSSKPNADDDNTTKSLPSRSPLPRRASTHQSHKPGDRYPTTSLTPPAGLNLDEVRSFFSDNSSERDRTASFRKRLTNFKGKAKTVRAEPTSVHSFDGDTAYDAGSIAQARIGIESRAHTYDGIGMSKTEFHIKRFGEKLRHLFAKSGEMIRSLSTRKQKRQGRAQDEWLADSLYSGV